VAAGGRIDTMAGERMHFERRYATKAVEPSRWLGL
jgi:hypothetical protein